MISRIDDELKKERNRWIDNYKYKEKKIMVISMRRTNKHIDKLFFKQMTKKGSIYNYVIIIYKFYNFVIH